MVLIDKNKSYRHNLFGKCFITVGFFMYDFVYDDSLFSQIKGHIPRQVKREIENNIVRIL